MSSSRAYNKPGQDQTAHGTYKLGIHVAVLGRNQTLYHLRISIALPRLNHCSAELPFRAELINGLWIIKYSCIYCARISPAPNITSALQRFERGNAVEIRKRNNVQLLPGIATHIIMKVVPCMQLCEWCRKKRRVCGELAHNIAVQ